MSGICPSDTAATHSHEDHYKVYQSNLKYAANELKQSKLMGVIEPINNYSVPSYFMNSYSMGKHVSSKWIYFNAISKITLISLHLATCILKSVNSDHLRLMVDIFHLQQICGNVTRSLETLAEHIGHVQIAQVPNRHEPDEAGELNYDYILRVLKEQGYHDWIGCEYKPKTTTIEGLKWLQKYQ